MKGKQQAPTAANMIQAITFASLLTCIHMINFIQYKITICFVAHFSIMIVRGRMDHNLSKGNDFRAIGIWVLRLPFSMIWGDCSSGFFSYFSLGSYRLGEIKNSISIMDFMSSPIPI